MATLHYTWDPPLSGAPDAFKLYEGSASGQETLLVTLPGTQTSYDHTDVSPGEYFAFVRAVYAGTEDDASNEVDATVQAVGEIVPTLTAVLQPDAPLRVSLHLTL